MNVSKKNCISICNVCYAAGLFEEKKMKPLIVSTKRINYTIQTEKRNNKWCLETEV